MTTKRERLSPSWTLLLAAAVVTISGAGCAADNQGSSPSTLNTLPVIETSTTAKPMRPSTSATTVSTTTTSTTSAPPTPPATAGAPPQCSANMGETLIDEMAQTTAGGASPRPPEGWTQPPQQGFDWDKDGTGDELQVEDGSVSIKWSGGSVVVTGVTTTFKSVQDRNGETFILLDEKPAPAAVGDVTGDGWLDLIVANNGTVAVLAGAGAESAGQLAFEAMGSSTPGWRSEPIVISEKLKRGALAPWPNASVEVLWDFTGDGTDDFIASGTVERASGPVVYYAGTRCWTRQ